GCTTQQPALARHGAGREFDRRLRLPLRKAWDGLLPKALISRPGARGVSVRGRRAARAPAGGTRLARARPRRPVFVVPVPGPAERRAGAAGSPARLRLASGGVTGRSAPGWRVPRGGHDSLGAGASFPSARPQAEDTPSAAP